MSFLAKIFGAESPERVMRHYAALVEKVNSLEEEFRALSPEELKERTPKFKERLNKGETLNNFLPEAFATVREAARRTLKQRHFDVQLVGGAVLHKGAIAEMKTGEGKTLVATLPSYLDALSGKGVHVVTVNDYLSRRDAVWMGQIYDFLGLTVGVINHDESYLYDSKFRIADLSSGEAKNLQLKAGSSLDEVRDTLGSFKVVHEFLRPGSRREAYEADITYGTASEFGFDYLRDNLEYDPARLRQRDFHYVIVDEIDSILIDEARTPLIISAPSAESGELYKTFAKIAASLEAGRDFTVDEKRRTISMTEEGIERAEGALGVDNIYTERGIKYVHHLETAVRAKALFRRDKEYVVREGQVIIVDEFTGRLQPGRRWSEGLHQAIEAREGVVIERESRTFASITYQNYFRMYEKLSGMTGTAATSREEFLKVYHLEVFEIPTNRPMVRRDLNDLIFQTEAGKFKAVARKVKELNERGQPVLIGTVSIEKNELLSKHLSVQGIKHEILNAKNHEREGEIIAQAGRRGAVTIATNMAGRGVDIKLGGNPAAEAEYEEVKKLGGLFVLGTERHEARRIDNQLRGRSGRQGDTGETQFFVSLEDTLMRVFASDTIKNLMGRFGIPEDEPIENRVINKALETAQTRIEGYNFDARKHILEFDDVLNHQRRIVYERRRKLLLGKLGDIKESLGELLAGDAELEGIIQKKAEQFGENPLYAAIRALMLQTIDMFWVEHLEVMDYMRGSVNLRAYGQRDPLVEYRKEGLRLFRGMQESINNQILEIIPNLGGGAPREEQERLTEVHESASLITGQSGQSSQESKPAARPRAAVGRNDPCPCGSGKKFKKCHGK